MPFITAKVKNWNDNPPRLGDCWYSRERALLGDRRHVPVVISKDMMLTFGRETCGDLSISERREWLVTNGIGGFASGTVAGLLTRRYHGLLVAALQPPLGRTLLMAKLDETVVYGGDRYELATNRWASGAIDPAGFRYIEQFRLEGTTPVWTFACADALLEKCIWMQPGANTTYVRYCLRRASAPMSLSLKVLVNYRGFHRTTQVDGWQMQIDRLPSGIAVTAFAEATPFYVLSDRGTFQRCSDWYRGFDLVVERYRGLGDRDDHLHAATVAVELEPGASLLMAVSTEAEPEMDAEIAWAALHAYETQLLAQASPSGNSPIQPPWVDRLVLAADQFIVDRPIDCDTEDSEMDGKTVIAGYPWFGDWGRDTMISLPGLTTAVGRSDIARTIIRTFSRYLDRGMLPNVFPDAGEQPGYNTVDAILWYFEAIRGYFAATGDRDLLQEVWPALVEVIDWHRRGTRYNIHVDRDGLIYAGEAGVQLTWMDAKVGDWVVTPRIGKPIEISALWYNALRSMEQFAVVLGEPAEKFQAMAHQTLTGFQRFWAGDKGYCYDLLDGPDGHDDALRPNQIFAVSLPLVSDRDGRSLLDRHQQKSIVDVCGRTLLTSHGLRSLAPTHPDYVGRYAGGPLQRDGAYHQGTTWGWLLGPYIQAHLQVYNDVRQAEALLEPMVRHLSGAGIGTLSEIFDGDAPMAPRGCCAQAWTVAEVLRVWRLLTAHNDRGF
ncbi:MAG: amylo-alpha-1,6-glucosidase [Synechococcus sp.]